jgi:hypothetical protein
MSAPLGCHGESPASWRQFQLNPTSLTGFDCVVRGLELSLRKAAEWLETKRSVLPRD